MSNGSRRNKYNEILRIGSSGHRRFSAMLFDAFYPLFVALLFVEVSRQTGLIDQNQMDWSWSQITHQYWRW